MKPQRTLPRHRWPPIVAVVLGALTAITVSPPSAANSALADRTRHAWRLDRTVALPDGAHTNEPSITVDRAGRLYVSAPIGLYGGNSWAWTSTDGGRHWSRLQPTSVASRSTPLGGGDTDVVTDRRGVVYVSDLWLGDDSIAMSSDHGRSWTGFPLSHPPVDDRSWFAYSAPDDALYQFYDGIDGLWVSRSDLAAAPAAAGLVWTDARLVHPWPPGSFHPSGRPAVDPRTGCLYLPYSSNTPIVVGVSCDKAATWRATVVPGSAEAADSAAHDVAQAAVDSAGNVAIGYVSAGNLFLAVSRDHGSTFSPILVSSKAARFPPTLCSLGDHQWGLAWVERAGSRPYRLVADLVSLGPSGLRQDRLVVDPDILDDAAIQSRVLGDFLSCATSPHGDYYLTYTRRRSARQATLVAHLRPSAAR
jgi:hypothetical protein